MYHRDLADETLSCQAIMNNAGAAQQGRGDCPSSSSDSVGGGKLPPDLVSDTPTVASSSSSSTSIATSGCGGAKRKGSDSCAIVSEGGTIHPSSCCRTSSSSSLCEHQASPHCHVGGVTNDALRHFDDAMALVETDVKVGYEAALQKCPAAVFQHECCPCYFLVACQSNPWDAAVRMCSYWKERIYLFEDRAFEPITLGSDVAEPTGLFPQDMKILETGAILLLPSDRDGRTVLMLDHSRLEPTMIDQYKSRLRVMWYMFQAGYRSGEPQAHKLASIVSMTRPPPSGQFSLGVWKYGSGAMRLATAMPMVIEAIHLLTLPVKFGTGRIVQLGLSVCSTMLGSFFTTVTKVHHGRASGQGKSNTKASEGPIIVDDDAAAKPILFQQLKPYGFSKRGIPDVAGGLFTYESFQLWLKRQRRVERKVIWTEDQRVKQKRDVNRLHSQQKRQRRRQEFEELQEQVDSFLAANKQARQVQAQLEEMLVAAQESVRRATSVAAATPKFDLGLLRTTKNNFSLHHPAWIWGHSDAPRTAHEAATDDIPMCPSILAALEPDPIAPSCLPRKQLNHRDSSGSTLGASSTYQAFETWDAFHSSPEHSTTPEPQDGMLLDQLEAAEPQDGMLLAQLEAMSADQLRRIVPLLPEGSFHFILPSDGSAVGPASLPSKFTTAEACVTRSAPPFPFEAAEKVPTSLDRAKSAPGHVQPARVSRAMQFQRQYLQRSFKSSSGSGTDFTPTSLLQLRSPTRDPIGPHHGTAVVSPKDFSCAPGSRGQASSLPPDLPDATALLDHFRYMVEPTTFPSTSQHSCSHGKQSDYSDGQGNSSSTPSFWPIDVMQDIRHDFSMNPFPLVDDTVFYDPLC